MAATQLAPISSASLKHNFAELRDPTQATPLARSSAHKFAELRSELPTPPTPPTP